MENPLATIEVISEIFPANNSDNLEIVRIKGYQSCVRKEDNYKKGQSVVFIFTDAIVPDIPEFSFLKNDKFRVHTKRFRGNSSQGVVLPLTILPISGLEYKVGQDVSEILGIEKYIKQISPGIQGVVKGQFPTYLCRRTDELNIQSYPDALKEFMDEDVYISIKLDGASATYLYNRDEFEACSRNLSFKEEGEGLYWRIAKKYDIVERLKDLKRYAICGEIVGNGIQGNPLNLPDIQFFVFNVFNIKEQKYVDVIEMTSVCSKLGLQTVPILFNIKFNYTLEQLIEESTKYQYPGTHNPVEGLVIRTCVEKYNSILGGRSSFKVINPNYID